MLNFILAAYGMTFILVYGKIFEDVRPPKDYTKEMEYTFSLSLVYGFLGWSVFVFHKWIY